METVIDLIGSFGIWGAGIVAGVIVTLLLNDPVYYALARLFGSGFGKKSSLKGNWKSNFRYQTNGNWQEDDPSFQIRQFGHHFVGSGLSAIDQSQYSVKGKLTTEGIAIGEWHETTRDGRYYFGPFQLILNATANELDGRWIGYSRKGRIQSGPWTWKKATLDS